MKKKVLVTGAAGFLGAHLVGALLKERYAVTGTCHAASHRKSRFPVPLKPLNLICFEETLALIRRCRPDWIFHLAARTIPRLSWKDISGTFQANAQGTLNLLEAMRLHAPDARILLASTIQVYGHTFRSVRRAGEKALLWPESPYAASKTVAEFAVLDYARRFGLDAVIARLANSLGRGLSSELVFPDWAAQIAGVEKGRAAAQLEVGNLDVWRDFLHVDDTVQGLLTLMKKGKSAEIYNIASGSVRRLSAYVRFLAGQARRPVRIIPRRERFRLADPRRICADPSKIRRLGWRNRSRVEAAITDILQEQREKARQGRNA